MRNYSLIKKTLVRFADDINKIARENKIPAVLLWLDALMANILHGASPRDYTLIGLWSLNNKARKNYITMRRATKLERWFNDPKIAHIFNNKQIFNAHFPDFVKRDWIYTPEHTEEEIKSFLALHKDVIQKPTSLSSGNGISKLTTSDLKNLPQLCKQWWKNKVLLEDCVKQVEFLMKLNPTSVNTLRIYTIVERTGGVIVLGGGVRVGGKDSPIDNMHNKGVYYPINVGNGMIEMAGMDIEGNRHIFHPSTGVLMLGLQIPNWQEILAFVKKAALMYPQGRYIGWDVALTSNGCEMIEGNYCAYIADLQVYEHKGLYLLMKSLR